MLMPLLDTPDTAGYMIAAYLIFIAVPGLFIASLLYRQRNLQRDEETLESLKEDKK